MRHLLLWIPALTMTLVSLISYLDRNTLALLAPTILKETGLSAEEYGWIISAFSVTYMISNPLWGRWLDRIGLAKGMTIAVGFWTLASVSHAFAGGFWTFALARAALGFGEGATFPGGLRTVIQTLHPRLRSRGIAVSYSGGSLGSVLTPIVVTPVAAMWGWRGAFWFTGLVGAAWLAIWSMVSRRKDVREVPPELASSAVARPGWGDPRVWAYMCAYAMGGLPLAFVLYISSIYLSKVMGLSQTVIGELLWIPPLGWEVGYFFWGWQADRCGLRDGAPLTKFRRFFVLLAILGLPLAFATHLTSVAALMASLFFAMFIAAGWIILPVAYATNTYSSAHAGLLAGLSGGAWSAMVAVCMPRFGRLFDQRAYDAAFLMAALIPVAGLALWWVLSARRPR